MRSGRFLQPGDQGMAVADTSFASQNRLTVGDQVTIAGKPFTVVGLVDTSRAGQLANANVYLPLADAQALSTAAPNVRAVFDFRADDANILFIKADASKAAAVADQIKRIMGDQAIVTTPGSFNDVLGETFDLIDRFGLLEGLAGLLVATAGLLRATAASLWERRRDVGLMRAVGWRRRDVAGQLLADAQALAGGLVLAWLAMSGLVAERRQEIGLMKAVGWRSVDVARVFLMEALLLSLAGGLVGMAIGWASALALGQIPIPEATSQIGQTLPGLAVAAPSATRLTLPAEAGLATLALALLAAIFGGTMAGWIGARRAAALKPAEALRDR
ncbi:MAG: ABC transporter permease [Actinobacteria bacterium]|nr:ABC transporter permease [Actinomycetota bacterium]